MREHDGSEGIGVTEPEPLELGYEDPIEFLRSNYCRKAVESNAQIQHIAEALGKPELVEKYSFESAFESLEDWFALYDFYGLDADYLLERSGIATCGDCVRCIDRICQKYKTPVNEYDFACDDFITIR